MIPIDVVPLQTHSSYIALSLPILPNALYEECVCRGTPSIGIITNSGLNYDVKLGHYLF